MKPLPPVPTTQQNDFRTDALDVIQQHLVFRQRLPQLVQGAVPLGDLVDSLRCGRYTEIRPSSGQRWKLSSRGYGVRDLVEWLVETEGYRTFHFSRTTYIAPPPPAPLPPQATR